MMIAMMLAAVMSGGPAEGVLGRWKTETRGGVVQIERCGASVCGRLIDSDGLKTNPNLADENNKDAALRSRPLKNLQLLGGFTLGKDAWTGGKIYNAEDGKTYNATLSLGDPDRLKVKGCIVAPLCKTQTWQRIR